MALEFVRPTYSPVKSVNGQTGDVIIVVPEADLSGYATEAYVDKKVAEAATGGEINLDGYATKVELEKAIEEIELTPGPVGPQGEPGKDGYTPVKDVDYFDGKDGVDGQDYVLTEADKEEIAAMVDVSGADVDLSNYYTKSEVDSAIEQIELTPGPQGIQGPAGQNGYTPVKGVDYFDGRDYVLTEEDKQEIAGMVEVSGGSGDAVVVAGTGTNSIMSKNASVAGGTDSIALGKYASAVQESTIAIGHNVQTAAANQTVIGRYNSRYPDKTFIIGNGSSSSDVKNAMMINADNKVYFPGTVVIGADEEEVATKAYVDANAGGGDHPVQAGAGANSVMTLGASAASGPGAIALGNYANATGAQSVAIGSLTQASQLYSVAIGDTAKATHADAVAIGYNTITGAAYQTALGKYNAADSNAVFVVGNGSFSERKNAMTIDNNSVAHFPGGVKVGADDSEVATKEYVVEYVGDNMSEPDLSDYATIEYVDNAVANAGGGSGGGAEIKHLDIVAYQYAELTEEETAFITNFWKTYIETGDAALKAEIYFTDEWHQKKQRVTDVYIQGTDGIHLYTGFDEYNKRGHKWYYLGEPDETGNYNIRNQYSFEYEYPNAPNKVWKSVYLNTSATNFVVDSDNYPQATMVKLVGYWGEDQYKTVSFDYTSKDGRYVWAYRDDNPVKHYTYDPIKKAVYSLYSYYGEFALLDEDDNNVMGTDFHPTCAYIYCVA